MEIQYTTFKVCIALFIMFVIGVMARQALIIHDPDEHVQQVKTVTTYVYEDNEPELPWSKVYWNIRPRQVVFVHQFESHRLLAIGLDGQRYQTIDHFGFAGDIAFLRPSQTKRPQILDGVSVWSVPEAKSNLQDLYEIAANIELVKEAKKAKKIKIAQVNTVTIKGP